ncbi:hypothetical protein [Flavobacterium granuli]|uniref:VanZ family protein n=1 Tax=Flavobacterium granuli TaxID=280093 RepID=A0ABU1S4L9_9FLAO|nr:hypothetical protein [Flavobacterium granuli]MDR6845994.1 VanZ family protein [Flavobacterium granuli]
MKDLLFTNWHIMRIFRFAFAVFLFAQAYYTNEWFFIAFGLFFFIQAIFNTSCGPKSCSILPNKYTKK